MSGERRRENHVEIAIAAAKSERTRADVDACDGRDVVLRVFRGAVDSLYRFILLRVGRDRDAADDLLQQTCCEAARNARPPGDEGECEAWLRGIARNLVRQHWRRAARQGCLVPLEEAVSARQLADDLESRPLPQDVLIKDESLEQLLLAVTSLAAADQSLIFAYYFDGRSQAQLAGELGVTEKSIESRLYRARGRLR